jgi:hypothetical protein
MRSSRVTTDLLRSLAAGLDTGPADQRAPHGKLGTPDAALPAGKVEPAPGSPPHAGQPRHASRCLHAFEDTDDQQGARPPAGTVIRMEVVASQEAIERVRDGGGRLFVWLFPGRT